MPEVVFRVRLPDESEIDCYSPSTVIKEYFVPGARYALTDFMARSRAGLNAASERVRAKYGYACSAALDQLADLEAQAERFAATPDAPVLVMSFEE